VRCAPIDRPYAATQAHDHLAATLHGAADGVTLNRPHPGVARRLHERYFEPAHARLGEHAWHTAYATGARRDPDHAIQATPRSMTRPITAPITSGNSRSPSTRADPSFA
jgi:hypothetical protein